MELKIKNTYNNFLLEDIKEIKEYNSFLHLFIHKKTKARLIYLKNNQKNNVFAIGFRTPPKDSTGVAHILEHSVLCGSKKYPTKDPFAEIIKSSITTFINAFTYPDKTIYPFSTNNDKEFNKIMDIYLDAVFNPKLLENENIFKQEGWRFELNNKFDEIKYSGVVYGEMKGVFSSPINILVRKSSEFLFPDTIYKNESGGDPKEIVNLTYEEIKEFHKNYYSPQNSYLYISGNCNILEKLEFIDNEYLSKFKKIKVDSKIKIQKSFEKKIIKEIQYNINNNENNNKKKEENLKNKTFISDNYIIGKSSNTKEILGFEILDNILFNMASSPLKKELLNANLAEDIFSSFDQEFQQPVYSIILQNTNPEIKTKYEEILNNTLIKLSKKIDRNLIEAAVNQKEFELKENTSNYNSPFLDIFTEIMTTYLYDDKDYISKISYQKNLDYIKKNIENNFFEKLIKKYLLKNNHSCLITLKPKIGEDYETKIKEKLKNLKKKMSEKKINEMISDTKKINEYIKKKDTKEDIATIKQINLEDINPNPDRYTFTKIIKKNYKILFNNLNNNINKTSNGITYLNYYFDIKNISKEKLQYLNLLVQILEEVKTKKYSDIEFSNLINTNIGEISFHLKNFSNIKTNKLSTKLIVSLKFLEKNSLKITEILNEYFNNVILDSNKIKEFLQRIKSNLKISITQNGHIFSKLQVKSKLSMKGKLDELSYGFEFYEFILNLDKNFKKNKDEILKKLSKLYLEVFNNKKENELLISISSHNSNLTFLNKVQFNKEGNQKITKNKNKQENNSSSNNNSNNKYNNYPNIKINTKTSTGIKTQSIVNYVGMGNSLNISNNKYEGKFEVIKNYLRYEYLWNNIRIKGGAYGCLVDFDFNGNLIFASYRDPNIKKSIETFKEFSSHLEKKEFTNEEINKLIIGTISKLDSPIDDSTKLLLKTNNFVEGINYDFTKTIRNEILNTNSLKIKESSKIFNKLFSKGKICVIGNNKKIEENKELFNNFLNL